MKKVLTFFLFAAFLCLCTQTASSQQEKQQEKEEKEVSKTEVGTELPKRSSPPYNPAGRKDPFRDLLARQEEKKATTAEGEPLASIDNIVLIGIAKARGTYTAIVTSPEQDFPLFIKAGHQFADGFVLRIEDTKITFRKTKQRGVLLFKPKDVVKEITPEELR